MSQRVLFIDRDGTLISEPEDEQIDSFEKLKFLPYMFNALSDVARSGHYRLVMVTNQDGLGTASFPEDTFWPVHNFILETLTGQEIVFDEILIDKSFEHENKDTRKPGTGMLGEYLNGDYDLENSWVIGDRTSDIELARNLGTKGILITDTPRSTSEDGRFFEAKDWKEIYTLIKPVRQASVSRETKETNVEVSVALDGTGQADISTGLGFLDHMLEQIARHGGLDLRISVQGDLEVDEHHTIEDTAITLGSAIHLALGDKIGIGRYGFCLPMDDSQATVALDFGGRNWIEWEAEFKREKIGDFPTEMFFHFFKSFSDSAKCNLHILATGNNEHHKIEAIFKAFAKAIQMAVSKREGDFSMPSTKGMIE